jgi:probable rRNA maturation factor
MVNRLKTVPPVITVRNLQRSVKIDVAELATTSEKARSLCLKIKRKRPTELMKLHQVSVLLVSDRRMRALHHQFLGKNSATDVLTFRHGEIVVSVDTAARNAGHFRQSLAQELCLYVIHGLLHLHGFDDGTSAKARIMDTTQRRILRNV